MPIQTIKPCGGGVIKDRPANELAPNQWSGGANMRFANELAERRGGFRVGEGWTEPGFQPYTEATFTTPDGDRFIVYCGLAKVYGDDGATAYNLTPQSAGVDVDFTGGIDDRVIMFDFGGLLILNHPVDGPFYWDGNPANRFVAFTGLGTITKFYAMRAFKNYLIGMRPTMGGVEKPYLTCWSDAAEPGSLPTTWTAAADNDAGDTPQAAETGGLIIDGCKFGEMFLVFKQDSFFPLEFVGSNQIFAMRKAVGVNGLLARNCAVETDAGVVFFSNGDLRIYKGGTISESIVEGVNRRWLTGIIDGTYAQRAFVVINPMFSEVWSFFPSYGESVPNMVYAWNWREGTPAIHEIPPCTCATVGLIADTVESESWDADPLETWASDTGPWYSYSRNPNEPRLIVATTGPDLVLADTGSLDLDEPIEWYLEKSGTTLGDNEGMKVIKRLRPQASAASGAVFTIKAATVKHASDTPSFTKSTTYTVGTTDWANLGKISAGKFMAHRFEGNDTPPIAFRSYDIDYEMSGLR